MVNKFYVYEHIRSDTGAVFYVGKGIKDRHKSNRNRNRHWHNVVNKSGGFESKIVCDDESEELILLAEIELIHKLRSIGVKLVNITDGGDGTTGMRHSEKSRKLMSEKNKGKSHKHTEESKAKIRIANTGTIFSEERKEKIRQKAIGRKMQDHVRDLLSKRMKSFKHSEETKDRLRMVNIGRKHTAEALKKMSDWQKDRQKLKCPHCGKLSSAGNASRWHFENCKLKD